MLFPDENGWCYLARASLFCAVTPIRYRIVDLFQKGAERDSFSFGFCRLACFSRACGAGWSKQLVKARWFIKRCGLDEQTKVAFKMMKGTDTLMRCTILVKRNLQFFLGNQALFACGYPQ